MCFKLNCCCLYSIPVIKFKSWIILFVWGWFWWLCFVILCLLNTWTVVGCYLHIIVVVNYYWSHSFFVILLAIVIVINIFSIHPFSIANIFLLIVLFAYVNITFKSFISLECIIHFSIFNINYQINLIPFYFIWLFQLFLFYVIYYYFNCYQNYGVFFNHVYMLVFVMYDKFLSVLYINCNWYVGWHFHVCKHWYVIILLQYIQPY